MQQSTSLLNANVLILFKSLTLTNWRRVRARRQISLFCHTFQTANMFFMLSIQCEIVLLLKFGIIAQTSSASHIALNFEFDKKKHKLSRTCSVSRRIEGCARISKLLHDPNWAFGFEILQGAMLASRWTNSPINLPSQRHSVTRKKYILCLCHREASRDKNALFRSRILFDRFERNTMKNAHFFPLLRLRVWEVSKIFYTFPLLLFASFSWDEFYICTVIFVLH